MAKLKKSSFVLAMVVMMAMVMATSLPAQAATKTNTSSVSAETLALVNNQRSAAGLTPLKWSDQLQNDASIRAMECAISYSHTRPDGTDWWTVDSDNVYGENLASNYTTAKAVVDAWMASPAHKANILNSGYATIGIATYTTESGDVYWAEEFGY